MRIKTKILIPMLALTIIVAAAILISNIMLFSNFVNNSMLQSVTEAAAIAANNVEMLKMQSKEASLYMADNNSIINAVANNNRDELLRVARLLQNETGVEFCTITDGEGTVIVRTHEPDNFGDSIATQANVKSALSRSNLTAIEKGSAVKLSIRSGSPVIDSAGRVIGVVSVGFRLDTEQFVDSQKALLGCETAIFLEDERISTTVLQADGTRAIGTKATDDISGTVLAGGIYTGSASVLGRAAIANYSPIIGPDGSVLGMMFVGRYLDESTKMIWSFVQTGLIITIILLAISVAVILFLAKHIVTPINTMVKAASALAVGDTDNVIEVNTKDEIRTLADTFNNMVENTRNQIQILEKISKGDLTISLQARSERDMMNNAIISMLEINNNVFSNIINSANQVASGSKQIADSSQALAQGAVEQTESIDDLSSTVAEIAQKIKNNAETAGEAARLADTIRDKAETGNKQMNEMIGAVKEINQSSQNINKVIKVIDDIAFQTNILALNAAVEAARAGQNGKGFAVVAEEVRNLASKSAEAAKDTGIMIQDSIQKAELGVSIADKTAKSLIEIVADIDKSGKLITEIANSSEEQSLSITQVNSSIEQVAQIVQQNSATSEENAAASEEMTSLSSFLQELVSQFKLKSS